jgi:hypothetical protein
VRTNIEIDAALRELVEHRSRQKLRDALGKYPWEGDLDRMRGRVPRASE